MKTRRPYPGRLCGFSLMQIAVLMGCSHATAKLCVQRARKQSGGEVSIEILREVIYQYWERQRNKEIDLALESLRYNFK